MPSLFSQIKNALSSMKSGSVPIPSVAILSPSQCIPAGSAGYSINKDTMYFTIRVNEFHLAQNRRWFSIYDPLVFIETEFSYHGERVVIPRAVGPDTIAKRSGESKEPIFGTILQDFVVAGPYPYRGGDVDVSIRLYAVERVNYARALLSVVDGISSAVGSLGELEAVAKTGLVLVRGIEALLGLKETQYLAGARVSTTAAPVDPFRGGFSVLCTPPAPALSMFRVEERRLQVCTESNKFAAYTGSDFVLVGIAGSSVRGDESQLPFYRLKDQAMRAVLDGASSWGRAKAILLAAYQEMIGSPDLTISEANSLFDSYLVELGQQRERLQKVRAMAAGGDRLPPRKDVADRLDAAATRLGIA